MAEPERLSLREAGMIVAAIAVSPLLPVVWRLQKHMNYAKQLTALVGAWAFGLWVGINWMGSLINPQSIMGNEPAWVATAEGMAMNAVILAAVCTAAWIVLDYRYNGADSE